MLALTHTIAKWLALFRATRPTFRPAWFNRRRQPEGKVLRHGLGGGAPQAAFGARMWLPKVLRAHTSPIFSNKGT